jgi:hypothetical protein
MNKHIKKYAAAASMGMFLVGAVVGDNNAYAQGSGSNVANVIKTEMTSVGDKLTEPLINKAVTDADMGHYNKAAGMMWSVASIARSEGNAGEYRKANAMDRLLRQLGNSRTQSARNANSGYAYNPRWNAQTNYYADRMHEQQQQQADWQQRQAAQQQYAQRQQDMQQQYAQQQYRYAQQELYMRQQYAQQQLQMQRAWMRQQEIAQTANIGFYALQMLRH